MQKKQMYRLIADEGKVLTDGKMFAKVIDILAENLHKWQEVDENKKDENEEQVREEE
jgi:hypothetical protein